MTDYKCPKCRGGFPAAAVALDDECPWCGKAMDGNGDSSSVLSPPPQPPEERSIDTPSASRSLFENPVAPQFDIDEPIYIPHLRLDEPDNHTGRPGGLFG